VPVQLLSGKQLRQKFRRWVCACDEMQITSMSLSTVVNSEGIPVTEYLREITKDGKLGLVKDPHPEKGRALRHKAGATEKSWKRQKNKESRGEGELRRLTLTKTLAAGPRQWPWIKTIRDVCHHDDDRQRAYPILISSCIGARITRDVFLCKLDAFCDRYSSLDGRA